ncbi:MAG TPA: hypothetical protein D7I00_07170 [Candidatus Poseidoniales archaeon]|nr:MAG TPA: hypothetical protein D7I00_07170 [Candidatus Poseidoniales archaeon]
MEGNMRSLAMAIGMLLLAAPVAAHELVIYTVIVNDEGPQPADVPENALKVGDSVWFWMKDSTENMSLVVELSKDGASARSPTLIYECALDENGTLVDENCKNRFEFTFNGNASIGLWDVSYMKSINGSVTETLYGSVTINEDVHLDGNHTHDDAQSETQNQDSGVEPTTQLIAMAMAIVSAIGLGLLLLQPEKKTLVEEE